jgi:PAS domain S-box-containing protein
MDDGCKGRHSSAAGAAELRRHVDELERANKRLSQQVSVAGRQRYQDLIDNMNDIIYTMDREGIVLSVNQAVKRIMGFDPQEVIRTHYSRWMPKEDFDKLEATRSDTLKGQRTTNQVAMRDKEGNEHYVEISISPLVVDGRIEGTQGIIRDITARHRAERAVREGEERLLALFNVTTESIFLLDCEGTVLTLNETAARRFGKSVDELIGTKIADVGEDLFPRAAVEYRTRRISEVLRTKQPVRFEDERAGRCFDTSAYPLCDLQGNVHQIAIFGKDITDRKRAEEEIRTLQRQTEFVLGVTKTGLSITDGDFNVRYVAPPWEKIYGPYQGKKCYEYFRGADHACPECGIPKALATQQVVVCDAVLAKEGNRQIQRTTIPFQAENGEWLAAEVNVDITERKVLEQKVRESEQRYRAVVETAGETIAIVDAQGVFQFMNTTAGRRLGGQPADFAGKTMWELFPKDIADRQMGTIRKVMQTMTGVNTIMLSYVGGQSRWYNTMVEPLKDGAGRVTAALVVARDIHDLKTAQQELEIYREKMVRAEHLASLGTLSAMLSHEMTQPLTVIRLSIQNAMKTLESTSAAPTVLDDLNDGLAEISSVTAIVQRFRDFAGRTSDAAIGNVSLSAIARKVIRLLEESARKARVVLDVDGLDELPAIRTCGRDIEQVIFTLAQNAIQAADGRRDHCFRVLGTRREDDVELRFIDDCGGIAPENLGRIFEPFFTTKPPGEGTGLGLCLVERVVSQMGGHLRVDSRWGEGTTFLVTLPMGLAEK